MPPYPRPEPDPTEPLASSAESPQVQTEEASFATDVADLAARFSAQGGAGLPPELAADLALEIVLNEIVMQACLATGATGAAIGLQCEGGMFCRATSGTTAPDLGSPLDTATGISGECVRTLRTQRCDDTLTDARVDAAASLRLGVRSLMVMPLLRGDELIGVFELFSSRAFAFGDRDERTLEALAGRVLNSLERAAEPVPAEIPEVEESQSSDSVAESGSIADFESVAEEVEKGESSAEQSPAEAPIFVDESTTRPRLDFVTLLLAAAVVACAVLLGILIGRHLVLQKTRARTRRAVPTATASVQPPVAAPAATPLQPTASAGQAAHPSKTGASSTVPPGGLLVYENGKEIFRLPPTPGEAAANQQIGVQPAATVEPLQNQPEHVFELPPAEVENNLLYRVDPHYPESARRQQIEGKVVLDLQVNPDGSVESARLVSGPPELVQAAVDAVRQWRFQPRTENGLPVRLHTVVTLTFQLPQ